MRPLVLCAFIALSACSPAHEPSDDSAANTGGPVPNNPATSGSLNDSTNNSDPVAACVERGIAYFKEIGSYPELRSAPNAGRTAEEIALERCQRTTTAF